MGEHLVICIGRQFGSGGHQIGTGLAQALGVPCYDKEILKQAAQESGIMEELFEKADEKPATNFLYSLTLGAGSAAYSNAFSNYDDYLTNDKLFLFQSKTIKEMAQTGPCVIIGRCADYILRGYKNRLSVFVHAPSELRTQRIARLHNMEEDAARALIKKTDKSRANYYAFYANSDWGAASTYDLCVNSGKLGVEASIQLLCGAAQQLQG